jgi:hypothetical protein
MNEVGGITWFTLGVWKPWGLRRGAQRIRCLICREKGKTVELQGDAKMGRGRDF